MEHKKRPLNEGYQPIRKNKKTIIDTYRRSTYQYQPIEPIDTKQKPKGGSKIKIASDEGENKTGGVS